MLYSSYLYMCVFYSSYLYVLQGGGLYLKPTKFEHIFAAYSVAPPLLSSISQGGGEPPFKSLLRPLATRIPSLGRVGQCAWVCQKLGSAIF